MLEGNGNIVELTHHPRFRIFVLDAQGKPVLFRTIELDSSYVSVRTGLRTYEDVKASDHPAALTERFQDNRKLLKLCHNIDVTIYTAR